MKPDPTRLLEVAQSHLLAITAPAVTSGYERASLAVLSGMLGSVRRELEHGIARRVEENAALRALFRDACADVEDAALRGRLESAAASVDPGLAASELDLRNAELRALLIELHVAVEESRAPAARRIEAAIWAELVASTERRQRALGGS